MKSIKAPRRSKQSEVEYLTSLREAGVTEVDFEYKGRARRVRRVVFGDTSPGDLKRLLENFEGESHARLRDGLDDDAKERLEKRLRADVSYHSA